MSKNRKKEMATKMFFPETMKDMGGNRGDKNDYVSPKKMKVVVRGKEFDKYLKKQAKSGDTAARIGLMYNPKGTYYL